MTYALVLGAGGTTGVAWETGLLAGLRDEGVDLTGADLIVGTSAGSLVGAQVATGCSLDERYERQVNEPPGSRERPPDLGALAERFAAGRAAKGLKPTREMLAWIGRQARVASTRFTEAGRVQRLASWLPVHDWPDRDLRVTAVDTADGTLMVWDRSSGVPLPLAVAASCAVPFVYPPVTIDGRRYMDGGVRSATNADLAHGHGRVVIVAPMGAYPGIADRLQADAGDLRAAGSRVDVLVPDAAALEAFGPNPFDPARRAPAARAGRAQAAVVARLLDGAGDGPGYPPSR